MSFLEDAFADLGSCAVQIVQIVRRCLPGVPHAYLWTAS
jgi:hypothetical protein